jgi:two-component system chemotaxis sensor kinase CheA
VPGTGLHHARELPDFVSARQVLIIVPVAALIGIVAALSLYLLVDRSSSKLPAFQVQLAKQNAAQSVANHNPTTSAPERRARQLRELRRERAERRARVRAARAARRAAAAASAAARRASASTPEPATTIVTTPAPAPAPAPVYRPAPKPAPKPAPRRPSGGGGGGSFDDSG